MERYSELEHTRAWNIVYVLTVANMATMRNFEVMCDKCSVMAMCMTVEVLHVFSWQHCV
jgi:hypothetical protein